MNTGKGKKEEGREVRERKQGKEIIYIKDMTKKLHCLAPNDPNLHI
jgi:hypothetical protein